MSCRRLYVLLSTSANDSVMLNHIWRTEVTNRRQQESVNPQLPFAVR